VEGDRERGLTPLPAGGRLIGGAIAGGVLAIGLGFVIDAVGLLAHDPLPGRAYRGWLTAGGWAWLPLFGAALGAWSLGAHAGSRRGRMAWRLAAAAMLLVPLAWHPFVPADREGPLPNTADGKIRAIRRFSYRAPATVARIVDLSRDPDPEVRSAAALAMGVNLIVTDIEHDRPGFPSRYSTHPLRDTLRVRLAQLLLDPTEPVRVEAARALWNAQRAFGPQPAAAETLAAVLDRRANDVAPGREAWLALDAAAGRPDSILLAAAERFAASTPDSALARAAHRTLAPAR
jgi:hypothetical protein